MKLFNIFNKHKNTNEFEFDFEYEFNKFKENELNHLKSTCVLCKDYFDNSYHISIPSIISDYDKTIKHIESIRNNSNNYFVVDKNIYNTYLCNEHIVKQLGRISEDDAMLELKNYIYDELNRLCKKFTKKHRGMECILLK